MYYQNENFNGTYDFRCRFHNGYIMKSHIHEYCEILYCKNGICEILVNGKKICLKTGEFVFILPNYIHQYNCVNADVICAVFSNDFIPLFIKNIKEKRPIITNIESNELKNIFEQLPDINKNNSILITAYLNLICNKVLEQNNFEKTSITDGILYQKVISYVADNFKKDISLKQISKKFGYNEKYLSSSIHSLTEVHFSDFINMYRIEYSKELLIKCAELSIAEIAMESGFGAVNTFNRQFKKTMMMTPNEYRKIYSIILKK